VHGAVRVWARAGLVPSGSLTPLASRGRVSYQALARDRVVLVAMDRARVPCLMCPLTGGHTPLLLGSPADPYSTLDRLMRLPRPRWWIRLAVFFALAGESFTF